MGRSWTFALLLASCGFSAPLAGGSGDDVTADAARGPDASPDEPDAALPPDAPDAVPQTTDHVAGADTWLHSGQPNVSFAGDLWVIPDGDPQAVGLMRFDLSSLAGAVIQRVELHIWTDFDPGAEVKIYPMLEAWSEAEAVWNQRDDGVAWSGISGAAPPSRGVTAIGTFTPGAAFTAYTVTLDTATVAGWVASPGTNFGVAFHSVNADGPKLVSREGAQGTRPFLRITHLP